MWFFRLIPSRVLSLQARKPTGLIGRYLMTKIFNVGNTDLNSFVMDMLELESSDRVLEIGFGTGKLINQMAAITTDGAVEGIDFSEVMLKQAGRVNKHHISNGKVRLQRGECKTLPYENESFNKLCSINTLYFWKDPDKYFLEMFRVIRPGGIIAIGFRDDKQMSNLNLSKDIFTTYSQIEVVSLLSNAGFSDARVVEKKGKPFLSYCALAAKA
jgi:ubiquinone/menaquinone biosynthesis C-methylase UbiE